MLIFVSVMAVIAAIGTYLTERIDRPRRRGQRLFETPAE